VGGVGGDGAGDGGGDGRAAPDADAWDWRMGCLEVQPSANKAEAELLRSSSETQRVCARARVGGWV
jgi:hypothetical protein